jgi:hypothetical protein
VGALLKVTVPRIPCPGLGVAAAVALVVVVVVVVAAFVVAVASVVVVVVALAPVSALGWLEGFGPAQEETSVEMEERDRNQFVAKQVVQGLLVLAVEVWVL